MTDDEIELLLAATLRDGTTDWPAEMPGDLAGRVLSLATFHGVASILHQRLAAEGAGPASLREGLRAHALGVAMREMGEREALGRLVPALLGTGARPLLFKGAALAASVYPDPALRERADIDILVGAEEREAAHAALTDLGWRAEPRMEAELASRQASYVLVGPGGTELNLDLHWGVSNSAVLAPLLEHGELWKRARPLPALHPEARGPCPVDAVLIACIHRLVHLRAPYFSDGVARFSPDRLIWLYDIRLLGEALSPEEWRELAERARAKGLAEACRVGLARARDALGAPCPATVARALAATGSGEAPDTYLRAGWLRREWMDFRAIRGARAKLRFLAEVAFPPADYMRRREGGARPSWLPWLYARRAAGGVAKRLRGRPAGPDRP